MVDKNNTPVYSTVTVHGLRGSPHWAGSSTGFSEIAKLLKDSIRRQTRNLFVFLGMQNGLAPKSRVSFT